MRGQPLVLIQRGLANAMANWELLLLRIVESIVLGIFVVIGIVAVVLLIGVAGALSAFDFEIADGEALLEWALGNIFLIAVGLAIGVVFVIATALAHAFVQAGVFGCYVEGELKARSAAVADRTTMKSFSVELWWRYATSHGTTFFAMYVIVAVVVIAVALVTAVPFAVAAWAARGQEEALILVSCAGIAIGLMVLIAVATLAAVVSRVALVQVVVRDTDALDALRAAFSLIGRRFGDVALVTIGLWVVSMSAATLAGGIYFGFGIASSVPVLSVLLIPAQIGISIVQNVLSFFIAGWLTSSYAAIALEEESPRHVAV